MLEDEMFL